MRGLLIVMFCAAGFAGLVGAGLVSAEPAEDRLAGVWSAMAVEGLAGLDVRFGSGLQHFYPSGRTFHRPRADDPFSAGPKWGYWRSARGRFCALWPPSLDWDCYDLDRQGQTLRFRGEDGGVVLGEVLAGP